MSPDSTLIKLCGMTRGRDVLAAKEAGADRVGLVIDYPRSPRSLTVEQARRLSGESEIPAVVVLDDPVPDLLTAIAGNVDLHAIQLSGDETPDQISEIKARFRAHEVWKVLHIGTELTESEVLAVIEQATEYRRAGADRLIIDARVDTLAGGTGVAVNWETVARIAGAVTIPVILAGGLRPDTVQAAIFASRVAGVDVSSGIESEPGVKDPELMKRFVREAREAFSQL